MRLTHISQSGEARMVDIGHKPNQQRIAQATGSITLQPETIHLIQQGAMKKGDVLAVARIAGIQAAKKTSEIIPLCHPLPLTHISVEIDENDTGLTAICTAKTMGKTGVEMEALTGVSAALLTIYDMCKGVDKEMKMGNISVTKKSKGE